MTSLAKSTIKMNNIMNFCNISSERKLIPMQDLKVLLQYNVVFSERRHSSDSDITQILKNSKTKSILFNAFCYLYNAKFI